MTTSWKDSDSTAGGAPLIDHSSPNVDDSVGSEARTRVDYEAEITSASVASGIDPTIGAISVDMGADMATSICPDLHPDELPASDRLLFDFRGFLEGGALDDVFGVPLGSPAPISTSDGRWEVTKLSGGLVQRHCPSRPSPRR